MASHKVQVPKVYRTFSDGLASGSIGSECTYTAIRPYFSASHPNTMWIINRIRSGDATPLVNILKARERMNIFFKYMYFQILDKPSAYDSSRALDQPMFNDKAYLFLNIFSIALYFRCEMIVRVLAPIRVSRIDNPTSYESISEVSIPQYAAYVHDHSQGDLLCFSIPTIMMRREAYFAIPYLFRFGSWTPRNQFTISYFRRNYNCVRKFNDWLEYAWTLVDERPYTKISHLVVSLNKSAHANFYLGDKVFFQPINCRPYSAAYAKPDLDERAVIVYRSYPRRVLCKLFLHKEPLRVMPQIIPFVRVFQSERFFVAQTPKALNPEFRMMILSSLEERFINITPVCNSDSINSSDFVEQNGHKTSIYDFDNIIALLVYFLVIAADRNVNSLKNSIIMLLMDILMDTGLLHVFSKEPAVNISYYFSYLVDGPFIQPNDLQHILKNIPVLLLQCSTPDKYFPPFLRTSKSDFDKQQAAGFKLFTEKLPPLWEKGNFKKAIQNMMRYRVDIDEQVGVTTLDYCDWKNQYLEKRLKLNLKTMNQQQQIIVADDVAQRMTCDDGGMAVSQAKGWKAVPSHFMRAGKQFLVTRQTDKSVKKVVRRNVIDLWTIEELDPKKSSL